MRVITAYSHNGGTGKTTSLLLLATAIDAAGKSAFFVNCDPHQSFKAYQTHGQQAGPEFWSDKFTVRFLHSEATRLLDLGSGPIDLAAAA